MRIFEECSGSPHLMYDTFSFDFVRKVIEHEKKNIDQRCKSACRNLTTYVQIILYKNNININRFDTDDVNTPSLYISYICFEIIRKRKEERKKGRKCFI